MKFAPAFSIIFTLLLSPGCSSKGPLPKEPADQGGDQAAEKVVGVEKREIAAVVTAKDAGTLEDAEPEVRCNGFPRAPSPLKVEGFNEASHVGPTEEVSWPAPVTVVLHGNFDRPEWECDTWGQVAGYRGWVLCPRGVPTPWADPADDRWTYRGSGAIQREIEAGFAALEERYPGCVSREETVLAGFSLGGIMAPGLVLAAPGKYPHVFLVEGGTKKLDKRTVRSMKKAGVRSLGLAMSAPGRRLRAKDILRPARKLGLRAVFVDMKGAGHSYRDDFTETGRAAMETLLATTGADGGVQ